MQLSDFSVKNRQKCIELLLKNKGNYLYYIEFTDEIRLSKEKFLDGELVLALDEITAIELGPITYIGEL